MNNALPVVSIVGRPNVGKSTLYNRIIRRREAIVDDAPGITRDRKEARAEWQDVPFTLVDTGGYIHKGKDAIEEGVTRQVHLAIETSDLVVFVTDCTTGITDEDDTVARILRKSGKTCLLIVNKVDSIERMPYTAEFINLGLGEIHPLSAVGGLGVGDLLSKIVETLQSMEKEGTLRKALPVDSSAAIKLGVFGRPNAGKSTFVNHILGEERVLVTDIPGTTRDSVDAHFQYQNQDFTLIDTAGLRRRSRVKENVEFYSTLRTKQVLERCDVVCLFVDADQGMAQQDLRVLQDVVAARKGVLLVINKWDLVKGDEDRLRILREDLEYKMSGSGYIPIVHISCKTGLRVHRVLDMAWRIALERKKRVPSAQVNKLIETLNQRYQPPAVKGKRIRVLYGSQVSVEPPQFVFFANHPQLIKETYKRFIENQFRDQFGFEGVPISLLFRKK